MDHDTSDCAHEKVRRPSVPYFPQIHQNKFNLSHVLCYCAIKNEHVKEFIGEMVGTMILLIFGDGVIGQVVLGRKVHGAFLSISLGWGMAVMLGVFFSGKSGKGQINSSVTLAMAITGKLEWIKVPIYFAAQYFGAFLGACIVMAVYYPEIKRFDATYTSDPNSTCYLQSLCIAHSGGIFATAPGPQITHGIAFLSEFVGTFLLASSAYAIIDRNNFNAPDWSHPLLLGLMVFSIVGCFALSTGAALNPARDFGPRITMSLFGYGLKSPFVHANYYFWIPQLAPYMGAIAGAIYYEALVGVTLALHSSETESNILGQLSDAKRSQYVELVTNANESTIEMGRRVTDAEIGDVKKFGGIEVKEKD